MGGSNPTNHEALQTMVSMAIFGALGSTVQSCVSAAEDRELGWLRQLRLTPLSPVRVVTGRGICAMAVALIPIIVIDLIGAFYKHVHLSVLGWTGVVAAEWIGTIPLVLGGLGLGYLLSVSRAQAFGLLGYIGLAVLGGLWLPISKFPGWCADIARTTPVYRLSELSINMGELHVESLTGSVVLALWTTAFAVVAVYAYRRGGRKA
jgi:ABC-2 type transport system permease protein